MATLDSILDASANAPVSAFTDHGYAGKLGNEVYGKERKRTSVAASTVLDLEGGKHARKRSSFMWLGKHRSHDEGDGNEHKASASDAGLGPVNANTQATEKRALTSSDDGLGRHGEDDERNSDEEDADDVPDDDYNGPPTTLLAELQLRKQQQKQRTQRTFPGGMHATLLELDAVAETQRKQRNNKRVNLVWEEGGDAPALNDNSDDEDTPLAIIAARNQGAQNVMDLNRPIGLMERREIEENEPLSHRRARLQGVEPPPLIRNRPSIMNMTVEMNDNHMPHSNHSAQNLSVGPDENEGETLADRKRRLAVKDEAENPLPRARPVSGAFSVELLSQFGDAEQKAEEKATPATGESETLGQRRRRLQAEREAREREMSFSQLNAAEGPAPPLKTRMSLANVLGAHPKQEGNVLAQEARARMEHEDRLARERNAKMTAMRNQMPHTNGYPGATNAYSGGFRNGTFNNGQGGQGPQAAMSSPALHAQMYGQNTLQHRASGVFSSYGGMQQQQQQQQHPYAPAANASMNNMGYAGMNPYGGAMNPYAGGMMQPGMQMSVNGGSQNRIEQWRQGVLP